MLHSFKTNRAGFTLIELVVVIGIFVMMAGLVLFSFRSFQTTRSLDSTAQELAATIREAQIYGIAVKGFDKGDGTGTIVYPSYGVYIEGVGSGNERVIKNQSIIFFADIDKDSIYNSSNDKIVSTFVVEAPIKVLDVCTSISGKAGEDPILDGFRCIVTDTGQGIKNNATVIFKRPNTEPFIRDSDSDPLSRAFVRIDIVDKDGFGKSVYIWRSGQVGIANPFDDVHFAEAPPKPPICPVMYIWDGEKYVLEHKLASFSSLAHEQTNIVPFETIGETDNFIKLRIREDIDESYIDRYALIVVDSVTPIDDLDVQLDSSGSSIVSRKIIKPFYCENENGEPCTNEVADEDGNMASLDAFGNDKKQSMTILFNTSHDTHNANLILKTRTHDLLKELANARLQISPILLSTINLGIKLPFLKSIIGMDTLSDYLAMHIEVWNGENWEYIGSQPIDDYRDLNTLILPLPENLLSTTETEKILKFRFSTRGQYFIDEIGIGVFEDIELKIQEAKLLSATNNDGIINNETKEAILIDDEKYHILPKGTLIDLVFEIPEKENNHHRKYFSLFNGYFLVNSVDGTSGIDGIKNDIKAIKNTYQGNIDSIIE